MATVAVGDLEATIDDCDLELVSAFTWHQVQTRHGAVYAGADGPRGSAPFMHRLIMDAPDGMEVDHINHDTLDNRRANLRLATRSQNMANQRRSVRNKSGRKGVFRRSPSHNWQAAIKVEGKTHYLGYFYTMEEAAAAYERAAVEHFGEFAQP